MGTLGKGKLDDECSVIGDRGEIGYIDFEDDKSVSSSDLNQEGAVIISMPFPLIRGKPQSILIGETSKCSITIMNTTSEPMELWGIHIYCSNPEGTFKLSLLEPPSIHSDAKYVRGFFEDYSLEDRVLQPHETLTVWLSCKPKEIGLHTSVVNFDVDDDRIERVVFLLAEDDISKSAASKMTNPRATRSQTVKDKYVESSPPAMVVSARTRTRGPRYMLPDFPIPKDVRELVEDKQIPEVLTEKLMMENYADFFSTLLIVEELHLEEEMRSHNLECVTMRRRGPELLALEVPGLAEKRPSLVHGDNVLVKLVSGIPTNDDDSDSYKGYIYRVEAEEVLLRFAKEFHTRHWDGNLYNVEFSCNRVNTRRLYQAIYAAMNLGDDLLFPCQSAKRKSIGTSTFTPFTPTLNKEQMHSVQMILDHKGGHPYVIYGPPGTGKTMTLVEAILQLYKTRAEAKVLVCAASNSAADHILDKLTSNEAIAVKENEIFRLNATSRSYEDIKLSHKRFFFFEDCIFKCPPLEALARYKVIISTYMSTASLCKEGIGSSHFSHIFLDEAGQASEPESMVPIANLCCRETVLTLAGDPKQLGPVVYSHEAGDLGLGKSYLERLFECELYRNEDDDFVTKLVRNYRCHPAILALPSQLFYSGELLACKSDTPSSVDSWSELPNKEFPVVFFGIQGYNEREGSNPSWFNRFEVSKLVEIIKKLTASMDLDEEDIGVITPYRQQVLKIRSALENCEMAGVKVGSVEQFQGQEREVIIVSTVRSSVKHNEFDRTYSLGFLSNPKRFNVAITRAKSLLVIVGNPHIVSKDPYWDKLLRYCCDNNSYLGCPLVERQDHDEEDSAPMGTSI